MMKLRAETEREEAFKSLEASTTELKCSLAAKTAEYNAIEINFKRARHEIVEKEHLFVISILLKRLS